MKFSTGFISAAALAIAAPAAPAAAQLSSGSLERIIGGIIKRPSSSQQSRQAEEEAPVCENLTLVTKDPAKANAVIKTPICLCDAYSKRLKSTKPAVLDGEVTIAPPVAGKVCEPLPAYQR